MIEKDLGLDYVYDIDGCALDSVLDENGTFLWRGSMISIWN